MKNESGLSAALDDIPMSATSIAFVGSHEREFGWESAVIQFIADSNEIARAARPVWKHPRMSEIERRRVVDHQPCRARCDRCSACLHSRAWYARGCRPFASGEVVPPW